MIRIFYRSLVILCFALFAVVMIYVAKYPHAHYYLDSYLLIDVLIVLDRKQIALYRGSYMGATII
jgi:hypothetical protein